MFLARSKKPVSPLERPLLPWSRQDAFTVRNLLNSLLGLGTVGSGKTSGPGDTLQSSIFATRSGGLVRCAKPEDGPRVFDLLRRAGRLNDAIVFHPSMPWRFNLLDFINWQSRGQPQDVVHAMTTIAETMKGGERKGGEDPFWDQAKERQLHNAVSALTLAGERVSGPNLQRFIMTAANSPEELAGAAFQATYHKHILERGHARKKTPMEDHAFQQVADFWLSEWPRMAEKTKTSVLAHVMNVLHVFNSGLVREMLSTETNCSPFDMFAGKFIISDQPAGEAGNFINAALVYATQRAILRRQAQEGDVPVVIWQDEYQEAVNSFDPIFLAQCRSHLGCMVALTQSIPGLYARFHGHSAESQAKALLANFGTHVICRCDPETADYASKLLGQRRETMFSGSMAPPGEDGVWGELMGQSRMTSSFSEQYQPIAQPNLFMQGLRTGGPANRFTVDAWVIRGEPFASGQHYLKASFSQK